MEVNSSDFNLPSDFVMPTAFKPVAESEGVNTFDYGKDGYVSWNFAYAARPWKIDKVKKYRLDGSDTVPVILFQRDSNNNVPIKLRRKMRYEDQRNRFGEPFIKAFAIELSDKDREEGKTELDLWELPIGFDSEIFQVGFENFKKADLEPGTSIANWRADAGQVKTLAALGIFTVDRFGKMTEESVKELLKKIPAEAHSPLLELHEMAIAFVNSYSGRIDAREFGDKIEALETSNERLKEAGDNKDAQIQKLLAKIKGSNKRGKYKKKTKEVEVVNGEIQGAV